MKVHIAGIKQYEGEYELDTDQSWTAYEWGWIKKVSGYLPLTVSEGLRGNDPELFVALGVIGMARVGKIKRDEALMVAEVIGSARGVRIDLVADEIEEDEVPLDLTSEPDAPSRSGPLSSDESRKDSSSSSGSVSPSDSVSPDATPAPTTLLRLGTSSM